MARMQVSRSEDDSNVTLEFLEGSGAQGKLTLNVDQLTQLIANLGNARAALLEKQDVPKIEGAKFNPVYRTNWALQLDALTEGSLLAFQHPAYGPVGVVFTPSDAETVIKGLQRHRAIMIHSHPGSSQKPS